MVEWEKKLKKKKKLTDIGNTIKAHHSFIFGEPFFGNTKLSHEYLLNISMWFFRKIIWITVKCASWKWQLAAEGVLLGGFEALTDWVVSLWGVYQWPTVLFAVCCVEFLGGFFINDQLFFLPFVLSMSNHHFQKALFRKQYSKLCPKAVETWNKVSRQKNVRQT